MGVFSRAVAHWESGGYGAFLSVPAAQPGLLAAIMPDWRFGYLKETMLDLQNASLVRQWSPLNRLFSQLAPLTQWCKAQPSGGVAPFPASAHLHSCASHICGFGGKVYVRAGIPC